MSTGIGAGLGAAGPKAGSRISAKQRAECKSEDCFDPVEKQNVKPPELDTDKQPSEYETDQPPYYHRDIF